MAANGGVSVNTCEISHLILSSRSHRISEKIFDDCMTDVVFEIDRINSEIVEHVYGAEFAHVPEATCLDSCL